ncbi:MAG: hypothetical protein OEV78_11270 [Spirochaetia bacterium]|nr:hypothetical protein [Spirochaetia bacterium]
MKRIMLILLFFGIPYNLVFSEELPGQKKQEESKNEKADESSLNLYPRFQLMVVYNNFSSAGGGFIPRSQEMGVLAFYIGENFGSDSMDVNFYWFFVKNLGLSLGFERNDVNLTLQDLKNNNETHKLFLAYDGYVGLQYRLLTEGEVILSSLFGLKSPFNYCCSLFAEGKVGFAYLTYNNDYINILKTNQIDNFPVNETRRDFPALALKYRLGVSFYFPLIVLEIAAGETWFLMNNHGNITGFQGLNLELAAGVYF